MSDAHEENPTAISWYDSFLLEAGAWVCLLATVANIISAWDFNPVSFRSMAERISLALWELAYSTTLGFAAWNFGRQRLRWQFTLILSGIVVADWPIWATLREPAGFEDLTIVLDIPLKFVFVLFLLILAWRESVLRTAEGPIPRQH